jgi:hypothetical protein
MASISFTYDVKISVVRPYVTKNLSTDDLSRISQTTILKYEKQQTIAASYTEQVQSLNDNDIVTQLETSLKELDAIHDEFDDLAKQAEEALKGILFSYDVTLPENESIANAERALFGSATGVITFAKYKQLNELEEIVNRELQERMIENNGILDVVA